MCGLVLLRFLEPKVAAARVVEGSLTDPQSYIT